jgi:hypothetical protein
MKAYIAFVFFLLVAGCNAKKDENVTKLETDSAMQTYCIGHSLIDLPDGYALRSGASGIFTPAQDAVESATIDLLVKPVADQATFVAIVKARHAELAAVQHGETDKLMLSQEIGNGGMLYRVREIDDAYQSEVHWLLADQYVSATIHSYKNQFKEAELLLLAFMGNIIAQPSTPNASSAFCLSGVAVSGKYRKESASLHFKSAKTPNIAFSVDVDAFSPDDGESLLQRVGGPNSLLRKFKAKESVLRKGELKIAGMRAQEWGASIMLGEEEDEKEVGFTLETMRPVPSSAAPKIHLEMTVKGDAAHDEHGATALWDSVTKTIRPR